jgi:hypothetical protein
VYTKAVAVKTLVVEFQHLAISPAFRGSFSYPLSSLFYLFWCSPFSPRLSFSFLLPRGKVKAGKGVGGKSQKDVGLKEDLGKRGKGLWEATQKGSDFPSLIKFNGGGLFPLSFSTFSVEGEAGAKGPSLFIKGVLPC